MSLSTATAILPDKENGKVAEIDKEGKNRPEGVDDWRDSFSEPIGHYAGCSSVGVEDFEYETEIINGAAYPMLPPNLVPW